MNVDLADEALLFEGALRRWFEGLGGVELHRRAIADPRAIAEAGEVLDEAGLWEFEPLDDDAALEAAAVASRAAGAFAIPYPVVARLSRRAGSDATALVSAHESRRLVNHADLPFAWSAIDLTGAVHEVVGTAGAPLGTRLGPFAVEVETRPTGETDERAAALACALQSWWLLGLLQQAFADTVRYTQQREAFGRVLTRFQTVQFHLADLAVEVNGLEELAKHTLWSVRERPAASALTDALGLRVRALEASRAVIRGAPQLHGAMGFTDEVAVSWLARASQAERQLPESEERTADLLVDAIARSGYAGAMSEDLEGVPPTRR